jgi:hypothetical protein
MIWIAPSEKDSTNAALEKRLWDAADQFRENLEEIPGCSVGSVSPKSARRADATPSPASHAEAQFDYLVTPSSIVHLLTEIIEPYHGRILETLRLANSSCVNRGMNRVKFLRVPEHKRRATAGNDNAINAFRSFSI